MCEYDNDDEPYIPNEYTMSIPFSVWRQLNYGVPYANHSPINPTNNQSPGPTKAIPN